MAVGIVWRNRPQKVTFQLSLEPEVLLSMRFQGNYLDGSVDLECNNLDGFREMKAKLKPELLRRRVDMGCFMLGRSAPCLLNWA